MASNNITIQLSEPTSDKSTQNSQKKQNFFSEFFHPGFKNPFEDVGLQNQVKKTSEELKETNSKTNLKDIEEIVSMSINSEEDSNEAKPDSDNMTPKSQKQKPSDVKRWASVVKAQKNLQESPKGNVIEQFCSDEAINSEILDCIFKTFPKDLESHKGFITSRNNIFVCKICSLTLESVQSLSNHLRTRNHEDNVINFFKECLPIHLYHLMEYVSFYEFNLCCNLCRCKIEMSSQNPYQTIVSIMAHNNDVTHTSKKPIQEISNNAHILLKTFTATHPEIMENVHFIDKRMIPQFKCNLCSKNITHTDNMNDLAQNFLSHLKSIIHVKNRKAVEVLELFGEANTIGKDIFTVVNGIISCSFCNQKVETELEKLISHVKSVDHGINMFVKLEITPSVSKASEMKSVLQDNKINEVKCSTQNNEEKTGVKKQPGSRLKELFKILPVDLRDTDCVIENEKGSIVCLICNRAVPPNIYNLRTHLMGVNHKKSLELKKTQNLKQLNSTRITEQTTLVPKIKPSKQKIGEEFSFIVYSKEGEMTCLICQTNFRSDKNTLHNHLTTAEHKEKENIWLNDCPSCPKGDAFRTAMFSKIPNFVRAYKCRLEDKIPTTVINYLFELLMKKNPLVAISVDNLVKNVDGRHCYCRLCKCLIPLSLDCNILESNILSHLNEDKHFKLFADHNKNTDSKDGSTNSTKVVRSLFALPDDQKLAPDCGDKLSVSNCFQTNSFWEMGKCENKDHPFLQTEESTPSLQKNILLPESSLEGKDDLFKNSESEETTANQI